MAIITFKIEEVHEDIRSIREEIISKKLNELNYEEVVDVEVLDRFLST